MLKIAHLFPELLGTYGDGGNALVLEARARRRGIDTDVLHVTLEDPVPDADIYLLGGGEDGPQRQATYALQRDTTLARRVSDGAVLLAVCAGFQIIGTSYEVDGDLNVEGLGLIDATTVRGSQRRVGNILSRVGDKWLVGFENHGGETDLAIDESGFGEVIKGYGNGRHLGLDTRRFDGVHQGNIFGTYAHGPVLALNPWFADELLSVATGRDLAPLDGYAEQLHRQRVAIVGGVDITY